MFAGWSTYIGGKTLSDEMNKNLSPVEQKLLHRNRTHRDEARQASQASPAWMTAASAPKRRGRPPGNESKPKEQAAARPAPPIVLSYGLWIRLGGRIEELSKDFG